MLIIPPPKILKKQPAIKPPKVVAGPPLVLTDGYFDFSNLWLVMIFDRAVNVGSINESAFIVDDTVITNLTYAATGAVTLTAVNVVQIVMSATGPPVGSGETLTAAANNGIVAVNDGGAWPGVTDFSLL